MAEYEVANKTYVKSNNRTSLIIARYTYTLIAFTILILLINLIIGSKELVLSSLKSIGVSLIVATIITYIINITRKKYRFLDIFTKDNTIAIALIIGLFGININIYITIIAIIITLIIKHFTKNINLSSTLYGIFFILLYNYFTSNINTPLLILKELNYDIEVSKIINDGGGILTYLFGLNNLSPLLSLIMFSYLFYKKGIKYNIFIYYILTIFIIMLIFGLFKGEIWLVFILLLSDPLLFLATYTITDYKNSPTIGETQMIYGIILGVMSAILRFVIPSFSVVLPMLIGSLLLVKPLDNLTPQIKYKKKVFNITLGISFILVIITAIFLAIIF